VLAALFEAVRDNSRRGYSLATHPLTLIGVEFNEVARHATQERLAAIGAPYLAISGDIAKPDLIAQQLTANGIDPFDVLHVNKSVIHNRAHCQTVEILPSPMTDAVFTDRSGGSISADESFSALVALFERWAPYLARHGMISIEAHTVSPERAARHIGRSLITSLDAPHGYSSQSLMEIHTHRMAADKAGLVRLSQRDLGA
ncbi:hypothetical protein HI113_43885, partial [Corallococcus exiguus]|uniref:AprA-related methyltransferase n=1 Tax=Corallococcus exiguus TaxID=83462 RepID=UPI0017F9B232